MDPFELTRALVALETPTGSEQPAIDLLDGRLRRAGYRTVRQPVTPGRDNLYAYRERPELVFSTHVDTVPPHLPVVEDDALMGIISIGDVVKHRLEELEMEAGVLHDLMIARG
ncbi:MAG TPA: hypothetical protein VFP98_05230 [Candidatus Polarisedimenticolia bacterium]|nr:hypothetical protein [Candidatus Polarisedimenticolia bacterium]